MKTILKSKIFILIVLMLVVMVVYFLIKSGNDSTVSSGGVTKQAVGQGTGAGGSGSTSQNGPGQIFVSQLLAIQNITINLDLFDDPVFMNLQDFHQDIPLQPISRPNPFAPVDLNSLNIIIKGATATTSSKASASKAKPAAGKTE